jgi:adenylate cyclase 1
MDHSVKAMNSHRKVAFSRLLNRRRFESHELEGLYQRYIFKLQQSSIISVLALFTLLTATLASLQIYYERTVSVTALYCLLQCLAFVGLFVLSFKMRDNQLLALCYVILLFCVLFCIVFAPIHLHITAKHTNDTAVEDTARRQSHHWFALGLWDVSHVGADGVWQVVFVTFLTYTMLPIKTRISLLMGAVLSCAHIAITATNTTHTVHNSLAVQQVSDD